MPVTAHRAMSVAYLSPSTSPETQKRPLHCTNTTEDVTMANRDDIHLPLFNPEERHVSQHWKQLQSNPQQRQPQRRQLPDGKISVSVNWESRGERTEFSEMGSQDRHCTPESDNGMDYKKISPAQSPGSHNAGPRDPCFHPLPPIQNIIDEVTRIELQAQRERERVERERWETEQLEARRRYAAAEAAHQTAYMQVGTPPAVVHGYGGSSHSTSLPSAPCSPLSNHCSDNFYDKRPRTDTGVKVSRRPPRNTTGEARTNVKYEKDQTHFIIYKRVDKRCGWDNIVEEFNRRWPAHKRTKPGLQGRFYRQNLIFPEIDETTDSLVFDENGEQVTREFKIRKQNEFDTKFGLLFREPIAALKYPWIDHQDRVNIHHRARRFERQLQEASFRRQREGKPQQYPHHQHYR